MNLPEIRLDRRFLLDFDQAIGKEWLLTNGIGGYASSTISGINTRKYHGLLVAAFNPPVQRWLVLNKLDDEARIGNQKYLLHSNEFNYGITPNGHQFIHAFSLTPFPTYNYVFHGVNLEKTLFIPHEKNEVVVTYTISNPTDEEVCLRISPLVNSRHIYDLTDQTALHWDFTQKSVEHGVTITPSVPLSTLILSSPSGHFVEERKWIKEVYYRVDASRGESCLEDTFRPGWFEFVIAPKVKTRVSILAIASKTDEDALLRSASIPDQKDIEYRYQLEIERRRRLLTTVHERFVDLDMGEWVKWIIQALDSFVVKRKSTGRKSVIAGYHWFEDWGRDALISLPGLTLVRGRFEDARDVLLTFKQYCYKGIIPNRFPDRAGDSPIYNTVDATLWYFNAILQYLKYTLDFDFVQKELWHTLEAIIDSHIHGTLYGIRMDDDGLIAHGPQLTWMDAAVNDWFVTPREGKAVEIQALWYNALKTMELLAKWFNQKEARDQYSWLANRTAQSFDKFWSHNHGYLFDVVHKEESDSSLRPNQIIAASLDFSLLDDAKRKAVVDTSWKELWGKYGLRTLSVADLRYVGEYVGGWDRRNRAYHNGTVWAWLTGPFVTAFLKTRKFAKHWRNFAFKNFLHPLFQEESLRAGLGTISEIFDGDAPHVPRGCIAQAWSVAENFRAFVEEVALKRPPHEQDVFKVIKGG